MRDFQNWTASRTPAQPQSDCQRRVCESVTSLESSHISHGGDSIRSNYSKKGGDDRCITYRLGCGVRGQNSVGSVVSISKGEIHKLLGDINSVASAKPLYSVPSGISCVGQIRQHNSGSIHKQSRGSALSTAAQSCQRLCGVTLGFCRYKKTMYRE